MKDNNDDIPLWLWYTAYSLGAFTILCFVILVLGNIYGLERLA